MRWSCVYSTDSFLNPLFALIFKSKFRSLRSEHSQHHNPSLNILSTTIPATFVITSIHPSALRARPTLGRRSGSSMSFISNQSTRRLTSTVKRIATPSYMRISARKTISGHSTRPSLSKPISGSADIIRSVKVCDKIGITSFWMR